MIETLRKLLMGLALSGFLGCPGPNPPDPPTPPTPTPPAPVAQEMLLTTRDAQIFKGAERVNAFMAIPCCMASPAEVGNARWPLASESWMDYTLPYGANFFHFRMGPFYADADHEADWADVGGPYVGGPGSSFNDPFWNKVHDLLAYAASKNAWVEINVIDTWYCKHAQWGDQQMPWPPADVEACGRSASAEQEKYIRKVVSEFSKYGNVIWLIDNEGGEIDGSNRAWYEWVRDTIKDEEQRSPFKMVHLIGTNNTDIGDVADYVADHSRHAVEAIAGRWTINNERNPEFSPEQEAALFKEARTSGLAWAFWRAGMDEAAMLETLNRFKEVVNGGGTGCFPPVEDDPAWGTPIPASQRPCQMCGVINTTKDKVGDMCGQDPSTSLNKFASALRADGYCAGKSADSVFLLAPDGLWEEHHVIAYTDGCYTLTQNGYKNAWPYATESCPAPVPGKVSMWKLVPHNNLFDSTSLYCDRAYCTSIGFDRDCCPARQEGDPNRVACEKVMIGGLPQWSGDANVSVTSNPWQARCPECSWIKVCNVEGDVCERLEIQ